MNSNDKRQPSDSMPIVGRRARFAEVEHASNAGAALKRIAAYFTRERSLIIFLLCVVAAGVAFGICAPSMQSSAIDIISGTSDGNLKAALIKMLAAYMLYSLCQFMQWMLSARLSQRIVRKMRSELFGKIVDLPIKFTDTHPHGDIMSRMTNDIENISSTVSQSLPSLFSGALTIVGTTAVMIIYCWQLTLLSFVTIALTVLITKLLSKKVRAYSRRSQSLLGSLNATVEETISGFETVSAYDRQDAANADFRRKADKLTSASIRTNIYSGIMGPLMNAVGNLGFVIVAAFGGIFAVEGIISIGVISAFIVYAKQLSRPVNELAQIYGQMQTALASAERVFAVLDEQSEDTSGDKLCADDDLTVRFENVGFAYTEGVPVIRDFSLTVPGSKKVALVGSTGSGKTTVVNLLERFYDPQSGRIFINDQDIATVSRTELRRGLAIVLQDTTLFSDTVWNNLRYGNENATDEQIRRAIELSCCSEMMQSLPDGYDTFLYDAGRGISQGQRQLLAIARAFVADPRILILDEATSNVDTRTEKHIQDAMRSIMKDRTSIVIAHRLSTIRDSDIIVVMDHGSIVESGSHEELLKKRGKYYELYMTQYAGIST